MWESNVKNTLEETRGINSLALEPKKKKKKLSECISCRIQTSLAGVLGKKAENKSSGIRMITYSMELKT